MSKQKPLSTDAIDALLPQTQCGQCDYPACRPYAEAIATQGERIDRCLPGGTRTLHALGELTQIDPTPYVAAMERKALPPMIARIREEECIGCTKCIQACPTDAILGAGKKMHTVITDACTGCELCVTPCPVDCIDMITIAAPDDTKRATQANHWRQRYQARSQRQQRDRDARQQAHQQKKQTASTKSTVQARQQAILAAVARAKAKRQAQEPDKHE